MATPAAVPVRQEQWFRHFRASRAVARLVTKQSGIFTAGIPGAAASRCSSACWRPRPVEGGWRARRSGRRHSVRIACRGTGRDARSCGQSLPRAAMADAYPFSMRSGGAYVATACAAVCFRRGRRRPPRGSWQPPASPGGAAWRRAEPPTSAGAGRCATRRVRFPLR